MHDCMRLGAPIALGLMTYVIADLFTSHFITIPWVGTVVSIIAGLAITMLFVWATAENKPTNKT